jgi:hypothetical protein
VALAQIYRVVQDLEGNVVTGVLGTVTLSGTSTLAALFADAAGTLPLPNPTTNNAQYGSFALFVGAGTYDMQFVKAGYTFETQYNITMRDPAAGVNTITGTANRVIVAPVPGVGAVTLSTPQDIAPDSNVQFAHIGVGTPATSAPIAYADQPAARTALGLGTMAQQEASAVAITGGSALGLTEVQTGRLVSTWLGAPTQAIYINDTVASNVNGLVSLLTAGTGKYNLNCQGTAPNYLGGNLGIATPPTASRIAVGFAAGASALTTQPATAGTVYPLYFLNNGGGNIGSIATTDTATAYNTSSDARLKHAVTPLTGALDVVRRLRPITHLWRADDSRGYGFVAHEVQDTLPADAGVITGARDAVDEAGTLQPQMIDLSKLVPWLTAALQEMAAHLDAAGLTIDGLMARVDSLEQQLGV